VPNRYSPRARPIVTESLRKRYGYRVLLDAGTPESLSRYFRYADVAIPADYELAPRAKDTAVVAVAQTNSRLIATHDTRMDEYVHRLQGGKKLHNCLNGLVLLPSGLEKQRTRLESIARRVRPLYFLGIQISWHEVWNYNLFVDLRTPQWPDVEPLCSCGVEKFEKHFRWLLRRAAQSRS
jgi:hypothetical protein